MLDKVVSGGQTGADQGGWRAARACGVATGGWMPLGWLTEDGPRPDLAALYGAAEMPTARYRARTEQNVRDSDATLWFGSVDSPGAKVTLQAAESMGKPRMIVRAGREVRPSDVAAWIAEQRVRVLNVAGNRESKAPGIGGRVERFLCVVFARLGYERQG